MANSISREAIALSYADLNSESVSPDLLNEKVESAFGLHGLGLIIINKVPGISEMRRRLLPLAYRMGHLSDSEKDKMTHPESLHSVGWSHGKEVFKGKPDYSKGSFYANPIYDIPYADPEVIERLPSFCHPNLWPTQSIPELEEAYKMAGRTLVEIGLQLLKICDHYLQTCHGFPESKLLYPLLKNARTHKSRLLYYFPTEASLKSSAAHAQSDSASKHSADWCGWHRDHGAITGLLPGMFFDSNGREIKSPDSEAGLYIRDRQNQVTRVTAQEDQVIFQIGETAQILSGGLLQATPHYVRRPDPVKGSGVSRASFATFMEPYWEHVLQLPEGASLKGFLAKEQEILSADFPCLIDRWEPGQTYEEFSAKTYRAFSSI